jgi:hypothetical protein
MRDDSLFSSQESYILEQDSDSIFANTHIVKHTGVRMKQLVTKAALWLQRMIIKSKMRINQSLSISDFLVAISDHRLAKAMTERNELIIVEVPRNVVFRGVNNIVFEDNVRIHSEANMVVTAFEKISINPPELRGDTFFTQEQLGDYFKELTAKVKALEHALANQPKHQCCAPPKAPALPIPAVKPFKPKHKQKVKSRYSHSAEYPKQRQGA